MQLTDFQRYSTRLFTFVMRGSAVRVRLVAQRKKSTDNQQVGHFQPADFLLYTMFPVCCIFIVIRYFQGSFTQNLLVFTPQKQNGNVNAILGHHTILAAIVYLVPAKQQQKSHLLGSKQVAGVIKNNEIVSLLYRIS